jgi:hypothetical protein
VSDAASDGSGAIPLTVGVTGVDPPVQATSRKKDNPIVKRNKNDFISLPSNSNQ